MSDQPPPYGPPPHPGGPSAPGFPAAFCSPPGTFPSSSFQSYPPQPFPGAGDSTYYQGSSGPLSPSTSYMSQPGYQGYQSGAQRPSYPWEGLKPYREQPKHSVYLVEQNQVGAGGAGGAGGVAPGRGGAMDSCLSACSAALCCCCLWDLLTRNLC